MYYLLYHFSSILYNEHNIVIIIWSSIYVTDITLINKQLLTHKQLFLLSTMKKATLLNFTD